MPTLLTDLAGRVPQRWRRRVPADLRNRLVERFGHPTAVFDPAAHPNRVNLGCGWDIRPGYLNVDLHDFHKPDLVGDVRSLPQLPARRYEEVIAQDVLEHLERAEVPPALGEWRRLLATGGRLWLRVPDLPALMRLLRKADSADHHREVMHYMFGTQAYDGDFHHAGFTDVLLCDELHRAGFERVELELRDEWLWEGEAFARAPDGPPPVGLVWGDGFYRREPSGRWAAREAELLVYADAATRLELGLAVLIGEAHVSGPGVDQQLTPGEHLLRLELAPGANRLRFSAARALEVPEDPRELAFQLGGTVERGVANTAALGRLER